MNSETHFKKVRLSEKKLRYQIESFLRTCANRETQGTYKRSLREFVRWREKSGGFRFQIKDVERYKSYLTGKRKLSPASVSTYLTALRRLCTFLVERKVLSANPASFVGGYERPTSHSRAVLSETEVQSLLAVLANDNEINLRDSAIVRLMVESGLSEAEIVSANAEDFIATNSLSSLRVRAKGKTVKDELAALSLGGAEALHSYLQFRKRVYGQDLVLKSPLFLSAGNRTRGERMSTRGIREVVNYYLTVAGIKNGQTRRITPHSLRHTAALRMAAAGATPEEIRKRMRLGTVATAKLYCESNYDHAIRQTAEQHTT
jgi:integrase/recombinase XerC/integrase/recombinase XerD